MYLYSFVLAICIFSVHVSIRYVSLCHDIVGVSGVNFCSLFVIRNDMYI